MSLFKVWDVEIDPTWSSLIEWLDSINIQKSDKYTLSFDNIHQPISPHWHNLLSILIQDAYERLDNSRLQSQKDKGLMEFHYYKINGPTKTIFDEHEDDYGGIGYKVNTVIYYFRKDQGVIGGDLQFGKYTLPVNSPVDGYFRAVAFAGNITHCVTPMDGEGIRHCIVIQLEACGR